MSLIEKMIKVYSPSSFEKNAVRLFLDELNKMHFTTEEDKVGNAIGKIGSGPIKIYLIGHIDTVPGKLPVKIELKTNLGNLVMKLKEVTTSKH